MDKGFQREERYIVLKLNRLTDEEAEQIKAAYDHAMVRSVVIEHDWPEYEPVWAMLEARCSGHPLKAHPSPDTVERMAIALWRVEWSEGDETWPSWSEMVREDPDDADRYRGLARAAISAMTERV